MPFMVDLHALTCWMTIRKQRRKVTGDARRYRYCCALLYLIAGIDLQDKRPHDPAYKMRGYDQHGSLSVWGDNPWSWRLEQGAAQKDLPTPARHQHGNVCFIAAWNSRMDVQGWALLTRWHCWLLHTPRRAFPSQGAVQPPRRNRTGGPPPRAASPPLRIVWCITGLTWYHTPSGWNTQLSSESMNSLISRNVNLYFPVLANIMSIESWGFFHLYRWLFPCRRQG